MSKLIAVTALGLSALLGLAACGSDSKDSTSSSGSSETSSSTEAKAAAPVKLPGATNDKGTKDISADGPAATIEVEADDFYFEPTFIKAAPGQKVTVELENEGSATHTFTSTALGVDQEVEPDAKATVEVTVPMTGDAVFFCRFHQGSGMQGAFFTASS